jgi:hypothetical protein
MRDRMRSDRLLFQAKEHLKILHWVLEQHMADLLQLTDFIVSLLSKCMKKGLERAPVGIQV